MTTNRDNENLEFYRGDLGYHKFILKTVEGEPFNLAGFSVKCQARLSQDTEATLFDITIVDGQGENDFDNGIVILSVPGATTQNMPSQCVYDIQATSGSIKITVAKGFINTLADVTR